MYGVPTIYQVPNTQNCLQYVSQKKKILVHETDQACLRAHLPHVGVEHGRGRGGALVLPLRIPNSLTALSHTVQM